MATAECLERLSLDVAAPEDVAGILNRAAQTYRESAAELESAWQDRAAGRPWLRIAAILERAADKIDSL